MSPSWLHPLVCPLLTETGSKGATSARPAGASCPPAPPAVDDGARGGTSAAMGGGVGRSQPGAGVPRERGQSPTARRLRAKRPDTGPAGPPQRPFTRRGLGGRGGLAEPGRHWTLPLSSSYLVSSIFSAVTHSAPRPSGASLHSWERRQAGGLPSWAHTQACPLRRGAEGTARTGIPWLGDTRVEGLPIAPVLGDKSCALGRGTRRSLA